MVKNMKEILFEKKHEINEYIGISASHRSLAEDFPTHTHDFYEIEFIISGKARHTINGVGYDIAEGDIYVLKPSDFHSLEIKEPLEYMNIMFSEQAVSAALLYELTYTDSPVYFRLAGNDYNNILSVFRLINNAGTDRLLSGRYIKNLCECIMIIVLNNSNIVPQSKPSEKNIFKTILYINRNFKSEITIDELSHEAGLSRNYFCSRFKQVFGTSTTEYINSIRLKYAKNMLLSSETPVTEICFASGFGSYSVFSDLFKKKFKMTPSQMRSNKWAEAK